MSLRTDSKGHFSALLALLEPIVANSEIWNVEVAVVKLGELQVREQIFHFLPFVAFLVDVLQTIEQGQQELEIANDMNISPSAFPRVIYQSVDFVAL